MITESEIKAEAGIFSSQVATERRINCDMHVGDRTFVTVTDVVRHSFSEGARWATKRNGSNGSLTFQALSEANRSRVARWHALHDWSPLEWAGAMCGEAGEAANYAKKLKRHTTGMLNPDKRLGADSQVTDRLREYQIKTSLEVADATVYGSLLCMAVDCDHETAVKHVFNQKSIECGFPERL